MEGQPSSFDEIKEEVDARRNEEVNAKMKTFALEQAIRLFSVCDELKNVNSIVKASDKFYKFLTDNK